MKYRPLNLDKDYEQLYDIWDTSPMGVAPAYEMLSPYGVAVTTDTGIVLGALFNFYIIETKIVLIGYPILSTLVDKNRTEVVDRMFETAEILAQAHGYAYAQTFSSLPHISSRLEENGWILGDPGAANYFKKI